MMMEQNETIRKYEMVVIIDAQLNSDDKETVRKEVADAITKAGAKIINSQVWLEKQKFTFEIKKCTEGTYYLINFDGTGDVVKKIESKLTLNERVLRFAIMHNEANAVAEVAAPVA